MEHLRYRSKARVIAIVDLVLTGISTLLPLMLFLIAIVMTSLKYSEVNLNRKPEQEYDPYDMSPPSPPTYDAPQNLMIVWVWILFVVTVTLIITQLVAGFKLVNATQLGQDPREAGRLARFWRNIAIIFTALLMISAFRRNRSARLNRTTTYQLGALIGDLFVWGCIIFRCLGIFLVQKFITEADHAAANGPILPDQNGQTPIPMSVMSSGGVVYSYIPPQQGPPPHLGYPPGAFQFQPPNYNEIMRQPYEKQWNNNPISQC